MIQNTISGNERRWVPCGCNLWKRTKVGGEAAHKTLTLRDIAEHLTQRIEDVHAEGGDERVCFF